MPGKLQTLSQVIRHYMRAPDAAALPGAQDINRQRECGSASRENVIELSEADVADLLPSSNGTAGEMSVFAGQ